MVTKQLKWQRFFWILVPVCHVQPRGIIRNATFIVDVDDVNFSDFKTDDLGSWVTKGTKPLSFDFSLMDQYVYLPESLLFKKDHHTRRYYTHATYRLFRRIIIDIKGMCAVPITDQIVI